MSACATNRRAAERNSGVVVQIGGDSFGANPVAIGASGETVVLVLAGTGLQAAGTAGVN